MDGSWGLSGDSHLFPDFLPPSCSCSLPLQASRAAVGRGPVAEPKTALAAGGDMPMLGLCTNQIESDEDVRCATHPRSSPPTCVSLPTPPFFLSCSALSPCRLMQPRHGEGTDTSSVCRAAIASGYRMFVSSPGYGKEAMVGKALKSCERPELYVISKLPNDCHKPDAVR